MYFRKFGYDQKFNGILIDTNLLLLVLVGLFNYDLIQKFKRTQKYEVEDFYILVDIISKCDEHIYTTPHILTEVTNLTDNESLNKNYAFNIFLHDFIENFDEISIDSNAIIKNNKLAFFKLGLTDTAIVDLSAKNILTLTDDLELYSFLSSNLKPVINYNHIKYQS